MSAGEKERAGCVGVVLAACSLFCVGLAVLQAVHLRQTAALRDEVLLLRDRLGRLEAAVPPEAFLEEDLLIRGRRSVAPRSGQTNAAGIPILDRPYGHGATQQGGGHALRVYDSLTDGTPEEMPRRAVLPHHRSSAAFHGGQLGRVNTDRPPTGAPGALTGAPGALARPAVHHRRSRVHQPATSVSRRGRVLRRRRRKRPGAAKRAKTRQSAEARVAPTGFSSGPTDHRGRQGSGRGHGRSRRLTKMMEEMRSDLTATAAHFEGHTSNYSIAHDHYGGNGMLRNSNPEGMFKDWRFASWMHPNGNSDDFSLYGGLVTVKKPGIYYLYAQINYLDERDLNGFEIMVSGRPFVTCLTMEGSGKRRKINTCHTSGVTFLHAGDSVSIRDLEPMRISMLLPERSFFGLVRLAGAGQMEGRQRY